MSSTENVLSWALGPQINRTPVPLSPAPHSSKASSAAAAAPISSARAWWQYAMHILRYDMCARSPCVFSASPVLFSCCATRSYCALESVFVSACDLIGGAMCCAVSLTGPSTLIRSNASKSSRPNLWCVYYFRTCLFASQYNLNLLLHTHGARSCASGTPTSRRQTSRRSKTSKTS